MDAERYRAIAADVVADVPPCRSSAGAKEMPRYLTRNAFAKDFRRLTAIGISWHDIYSPIVGFDSMGIQHIELGRDQCFGTFAGSTHRADTTDSRHGSSVGLRHDLPSCRGTYKHSETATPSVGRVARTIRRTIRNGNYDPVQHCVLWFVGDPRNRVRCVRPIPVTAGPVGGYYFVTLVWHGKGGRAVFAKDSTAGADTFDGDGDLRNCQHARLVVVGAGLSSRGK